MALEINITFWGDMNLLAQISLEVSASPEQFLLTLEAQLESGELTITEAKQLIKDFNSTQR